MNRIFLIKAEAVYKEQILPSPVSSHLAAHLRQAQTTNAEGAPCQLDLGLCNGLHSPTAHSGQAQTTNAERAPLLAGLRSLLQPGLPNLFKSKLPRGRRLYQKLSVAVTDFIISVHACKSYAINAVSGFTKRCWLVMYHWPIATNAKEVHSILGLASYYQRFIPKFTKIAQCLHELVGPTSNKHKKARGQVKGKLTASPKMSKPKEFQWMAEHQQAFHALQEALVTAQVLGHPDFNREFMLETHASLQGLGAVLSQQDETGKLHMIAYASQSLHPSERSMHNYSSAKLELLALKWAVMEKFRDYLLGLKFHVYTDNSPLAYVRESKLGASQIQWLSELALFDCTIHYRMGRSNRAANALSRHSHTDEEINQEKGPDCNEVEVISYSSVCEAVNEYLNTTKVPDDLKRKHSQSAVQYNQ